MVIDGVKWVREDSILAGSSDGVVKAAVGKYCICRSYNEGLNAGVVVAADESGVVLKDARRIHYHKPADNAVAWYEGVALSGLHSSSRVAAPVTKVIVEKYSLTECSTVAEKSIREHPSYGS